MEAAREPRCWKCGYALRGLTVDAVCPECGTPVWSAPKAETVSEDANSARLWGILSLVLFFTFLGPFAFVLAIVALHFGRKARAASRAGRVDPGSARPAQAGAFCAWLTIVFSVLFIGYILSNHLRF